VTFQPAYERLLELAERRLELLETGRLDDAVAAGEEQQRLLAALPERAPAEAAPLLERLEVVLRRTAEQAEVSLRRTAHDLNALRRARPALMAYVAAPEQRSVDRTG